MACCVYCKLKFAKALRCSIVAFILYCIMLTPATAQNVLSTPTTSGSARIRYEHKSDADFKKSNRDELDFLMSRFRLDMSFQPSDQVSVFFQPQYAKVWGENDNVPSSATANTPTATSGTTNDTALDVHQAYLSYKCDERTSITLGRKELAYGDHLLVGDLGWNNSGRAFDLLLARHKYGVGTIDFFNSKIKDVNYSSVASGDKDFYGFYSANTISERMQNLDAYVLYLYDATGTDKAKTTAYGARAKSALTNSVDYRAEVTFEDVLISNKHSDEYQWDVELGYLVYEPKKIRLSAEYFVATNDFDQLFPTGHKWLGYADLFSRRNIEGYRIGVAGQWSEKWRSAVDFHDFKRNSTTDPAYKYSGAAYAVGGRQADLATEVDITIGRQINEKTYMDVGFAEATPGGYIKANAGNDKARFYYLQLTANF